MPRSDQRLGTPLRSRRFAVVIVTLYAASLVTACAVYGGGWPL